MKFIGLSYLLVYVGAVSILFLFILMLINIRVSELVNDTNNNIPLAILAFLVFFIPFSKVLPDTKTNFNRDNFLDTLMFTTRDQKSLSHLSSNN
jgi:NADH:ubiquinone oxidoreductase subunit 6 (subunit J)